MNLRFNLSQDINKYVKNRKYRAKQGKFIQDEKPCRPIIQFYMESQYTQRISNEFPFDIRFIKQA